MEPNTQAIGTILGGYRTSLQPPKPKVTTTREEEKIYHNFNKYLAAVGAGRGASRSGPSDASGDEESARHNSSTSIQYLYPRRRSEALLIDAKRGSHVVEESPYEVG